MAATESDLSARVQNDVIGLGLDHFTKCVVLPQGEFAAFLRAKPAERKQLLERLLGLGLYERLRRAANLRWKVEEGRADNLQWQLDSVLAHATPEAVRAAEGRVAVLDRLREHFDEIAVQLNALDSKIQAAADLSTQATAQLDRLVGVRIPDGTASIGEPLPGGEQEVKRSNGPGPPPPSACATPGRRGRTCPRRAAIDKVVEKRDQLARREPRLPDHARPRCGDGDRRGGHRTRKVHPRGVHAGRRT